MQRQFKANPPFLSGNIYHLLTRSSSGYEVQDQVQHRSRSCQCECQCCVLQAAPGTTTALGSWLFFCRPKISPSPPPKWECPGEGLLALCHWLQSSQHNFMLRSSHFHEAGPIPMPSWQVPSHGHHGFARAFHRQVYLSVARVLWQINMFSPYPISLLVALERCTRLKER